MIRANEKIWENHKGLQIGVLTIQNCDNQGHNEEIIALTNEAQEKIRSVYTAEKIGEEPKIDAWKKAYAAFGAKPKEHKSSVENLYKMTLNGTSLRHINKLVDIYNYISLKYMLPVGGEDLDKVKGELELTYADNEKPILLLGDKEPKAPKLGEVIYKDSDGAICRRFNWREADRTKLTQETKNAVIVIECLPPATQEELRLAIGEMKSLIEKYCNATIKKEILSQK